LIKASIFTSLALAISIGVSGLIAPSVSANSAVEAQKVQSQSLIEHVKIIGVSFNSSLVTVSEKWYSPANGFQRNDEYYLDNEKISSETKVYKYKPNDSLFEKKIKGYQDESVWKFMGIENFNGKQVKKLKAIVEPKGGIYQIAYIDISTGLPIKEENYGSKNEQLNMSVYFFDRINDPSGEIFTTTEKDSEINMKKTK